MAGAAVMTLHAGAAGTADGPARTQDARADEDAQLARRAGAGDVAAFTQLVRRYQGRVYGVAARMLGDAHEAEDVAQEVFVALHRALADFRGDARLSTWVYRITRNHCLNRIKYLSRRGRRLMGPQSHEPGTDPLDNIRAQGPSPAQQMQTAQDAQRLEAALLALSPEHRMLVVLREVEQLSYDEIMQLTGLAEGTIKSRLHRARAALLAQLPDMLNGA